MKGKMEKKKMERIEEDSSIMMRSVRREAREEVAMMSMKSMNLNDEFSGSDRFRSYNPPMKKMAMARMAAPKSAVRMDRAMDERAV